LIDLISKISLCVYVLAFFPWVGLVIYLSSKLRAKKYALIIKISECAPAPFRERSKMMMESNLSWLAASSFAFEWFGYVMLRYAWRIPYSDVIDWKDNIRKILDKDSSLYVLMAFLMEVSMTSLGILFLSFIFL